MSLSESENILTNYKWKFVYSILSSLSFFYLMAFRSEHLLGQHFDQSASQIRNVSSPRHLLAGRPQWLPGTLLKPGTCATYYHSVLSLVLYRQFIKECLLNWTELSHCVHTWCDATSETGEWQRGPQRDAQQSQAKTFPGGYISPHPRLHIHQLSPHSRNPLSLHQDDHHLATETDSRTLLPCKDNYKQDYGWFALLYGRNQHGIVKVFKNIYIKKKTEW